MLAPGTPLVAAKPVVQVHPLGVILTGLGAGIVACDLAGGTPP